MKPGTNPATVVAQIKNALDGVTLGNGISLNECEYNDSGGSATVFLQRAKHDESVDWRRLITGDLTNFQVTFSFTDLNGFRFYLPPYMIWTLKNYATSYSIITNFTIYALNTTAYQFQEAPFTQFFSHRQLEAIISFLEFCCDNDDYFDGDVARTNLTQIREQMAAKL